MKRRSQRFTPNALSSLLETRQLLSTAVANADNSTSRSPATADCSTQSPDDSGATQPANPSPTDPGPTEPTDPAPVEPTNPGPTDPGPNDPTDPTPSDPGVDSPSNTPAKVGDVAKVLIVVDSFKNSLNFEVEYTFKYKLDLEVGVETNASLNGKAFTAGIKGSYKKTESQERSITIKIPANTTISLVAHYDFTLEKSPGWGLGIWSSKPVWIGRYTQLEAVMGTPTVDSTASGSPQPLPSPQN